MSGGPGARVAHAVPSRCGWCHRASGSSAGRRGDRRAGPRVDRAPRAGARCSGRAFRGAGDRGPGHSRRRAGSCRPGAHSAQACERLPRCPLPLAPPVRPDPRAVARVGRPAVLWRCGNGWRRPSGLRAGDRLWPGDRRCLRVRASRAGASRAAPCPPLPERRLPSPVAATVERDRGRGRVRHRRHPIPGCGSEA